jgi:hypothetical protein
MTDDNVYDSAKGSINLKDLGENESNPTSLMDVLEDPNTRSNVLADITAVWDPLSEVVEVLDERDIEEVTDLDPPTPGFLAPFSISTPPQQKYSILKKAFSLAIAGLVGAASVTAGLYISGEFSYDPTPEKPRGVTIINAQPDDTCRVTKPLYNVVQSDRKPAAEVLSVLLSEEGMTASTIRPFIEEFCGPPYHAQEIECSGDFGYSLADKLGVSPNLRNPFADAVRTAYKKWDSVTFTCL